MNLYQFINAAECVTFNAVNDQVAFAATILIGNGKAGCERIQNNMSVSLHTLVSLYADGEEIIKQILNMSFDDFVSTHKEEVSQALQSFAYVTPAERWQYDDECATFKNNLPALLHFKKEHEDKHRKSYNHKIVLYAWKAAEIVQHLQSEEIAA